MLRKPQSFNTVGAVQVLLAATFAIWLIFFPDTGDRFAWPVVPRLTAMFIGTAFIARTYLGYHLWRQQYWYRLRWQVWGNYGFLAVIFLATFWHIDEMNWKSNIWIAHIWVIAYAVEPLMLPLTEPRGERADEPLPPELREGPLLLGLKRVLAAALIVGITIAAVLFMNPVFADTRWPWPLDPFDARVMSAFLVLGALWAARGYFLEDWAEAKLGVLGIGILTGSLFVVWLFNLAGYDASRKNIWPYGICVGIFTLLLAYYYWRQEQARPLPSAGRIAAAIPEVGKASTDVAG